MKKFIIKILPKLIGFLLNVLSLFAPKLAASKALALFATPRKGKILDIHKTFLDTSIREILHLENMRIMTYRWEGKGKTVLLAHGWESNAFRWHKLVRALQNQSYNIIALDAPAHGQSGSKQFNAVLYADFINVAVKKFEPKILIGHSVGGMALAFFQKKYDYTTLNRLVLLGAPSEFVKVFEGYTSMMGYSSRLIKHLYQLIIERFGNTPESFSTAEYLKDLKVKGLIIHDREDKIIDYEESLLIRRKFKSATLITTMGFGHSLHHDSITNNILDFLNA